MGRDSVSRSRGRDRSRGRRKDSRKKRSRSGRGRSGGRNRHESRGRGQVQDRDDKPCSLIVRGLPETVTTESLREAFREFGDLKDSYIPLDYHTRQPKGFGFIQFGSSREAESAMRDMDGQKIDGSEITVNLAKHGRRSPGAMKDRERGGKGGGGGRRDSRRR